MAQWKKVVVSGSAVSQLNNDSGYLISGDSGVVLSGSFNGSFQGDGSNLSGITADTLGNSLTDGNGISDFNFNGSGTGSVSVQADGSTLSVGASGVKVADAGITATQLASSISGNGLSGGAGTALSVNTDGTSITTSGDSLTLAGTAFSSSVDSRIDAAQSLATTNSASIAGLGSGFATDSELSSLSGSAHTARASVASAAASATSGLSGSAHTARASVASAAASATSGLSGSAAAAIGVVASSVSSLSGSAHSQRVAIESGLDSKITTQEGRIDAILTGSAADKDSFAEIVALINSVDTTNDSAFAGYVTSSNANQQSITDSVTALSSSVDSRLDTLESDTSVSSLSGSAHTARASVASAAASATSGLSGSAHTARASVASAAASATSGLSGSAHTARVAIAGDITTIEGGQTAQNNRLDALETFTGSLDTSFATDAELSSLSGSAHSQRVAIESGLTSDISGLSGSAHTSRASVASAAASATSGLSGSAHTARASVASTAASATSNLSGSVLGVTNAIDGRVTTLEGASHAHSNKANLDQINQDLGTSDNVNFNDLVVDGNLTVSGTTTTVNTANLLVEDKFILLNSGSADPDEGGIIIDEGAGSGHAFIYDKGDTRWGFNASVAQDASTANATAHVAAVVDMQNVAHSDSSEYQKNGNIKVDGGSIFIYC